MFYVKQFLVTVAGGVKNGNGHLKTKVIDTPGHTSKKSAAALMLVIFVSILLMHCS